MSYFKDNYFKQYDAKYVSAKYKWVIDEI
jgi:hypothetical protein